MEGDRLAAQAAKSIKTEKDLCDFSPMLKKLTVETALNAELDEPYDRHQPCYSSKTLLTEDGSFDVE